MGEAGFRDPLRPLGHRAGPRRPGPRDPRLEALSEPGRGLLPLFVYGTLKRGQRNHDRFCQGAATVEQATLRGRLYDLPLGFPALVVPEEDVLAAGTGDYLADARLPFRLRPGGSRSSEGWDTVHGELMRFEDPEERLRRIDALEGFQPGEEGFYTRVLLPVALAGTGETVLAWAYSVREGPGIHLPGGSWPA